MATFNALANDEGVFSHHNRNFHLSNVNSFEEVTFLYLHAMAMLRNIVPTLHGKVTIMGTLLDSFGTG